MIRYISGLSCGAMLLLLCSVQLLAQDGKPTARKVKKLILPGESFLVEGRPSFVLLPPKEKRQKPQPWIMYSPTLPPYPDRHEKWMHEQFLAAGVAVAGIDVGEAYGSPRSRKLMTALYTELTKNRGFATKVCLLGRSRGGLWVSSWAIANPEKVAGIAGIYPVFDLRTYPGLARAARAYGMTPQKLESSLKKHNPGPEIAKKILTAIQTPNEDLFAIQKQTIQHFNGPQIARMWYDYLGEIVEG